MKKILVIFLIFFLSLTLPSNAVDQTSKLILDNGCTVLVTEMPASPLVSVYALIKTGSATEGKYLGAGISHFLEHMLFKGTHGRDVGELASRVQAVGGTINASTGMDYTIYTITVPRGSFDTALDILADMLVNAVMDAEEVEKERNVIFNEMRMRNDDPDRKISELTFKNVYLAHPYRHPVIGYKSLLAQITRDDLMDYYQRRFVPNNVILSIAGNINKKEVLEKIEKVYGEVERRYPVVRNLSREPQQISRRHYEEEYPTDLTRLSMAFPSIELLDPDLYALDVLAMVLGQGKSSRFYLDIYKKQGLVHNISAFNYTPIDKGLFWINCLLEEKKVDAVIGAVMDEIEKVKTKGITSAELAKAKQQVQSEHILSHQTSASIAHSRAVDEAFAGDPYFSRKYVDGIKNVSLESIKRVANKYLIESALTTVVLKPESMKEQIKGEEETQALDEIQKYVLKNGLTVLLKEDRTFPIVAVQLAANGGIRQEEPELNGLFHMLASAWTKGTRRYSANQIAERVESLGMQLNGFSGRNSFGLSMEFLSEQLPAALEQLKDLVLNPTFPEDEVGKVKEQMKIIIRQRDDDIFQTTAHHLKGTLFLTHPFRLEKEGTIESVDRITPDDLKSYYEKFAVAGNMVLSVFGDIDAQQVLEEIKKDFGSLNEGAVTLKAYHEELPEQTREKDFSMDKEQAMVMLGFQGVAFDHPDVCGLEVLATILGSSFNGRLFMNIREQLGSAYTLGGGFIPGPDAGFIYFYVLTGKEDAEAVKEFVKDEIIKLQTEMVSEQELRDNKMYLKGMFKSSQETNSDLSFMVSLDELYGLGFKHYRDYDSRIDEVTSEDIKRLAVKYLDIGKAAVVVTLPN